MRHEIPGVLYRVAPIGPAIPLVLDSPHSGTQYPDDFRHAAPLALVRKAEDSHIDDIFGAGPELGATLIAAHFPRAYLDPNRSLADIDPTLLDEPWPEPLSPGEKTKSGIGLIWRLAAPGVPMYDRKLTVAETRARIDRYWRPYHAVIEEAIEAAYSAHGAVWHINCHSMKSVGDERGRDNGRRRADFVLGDRDGTTCDRGFTEFVAGRLRAKGYGVAINDPYKGVELVRLHGRPNERRHSLQIEINRGLYMDEDTWERTANYGRLRFDVSELLRDVADWVRGQVG
jgi:N-formylglutamate amidohydrolase